MNQITYETVETIDAAELASFYRRQGHTTTDSPEKLSKMMANSFCLVVARCNGELVGLARGVTDGVRGWLTECKLDPSCQGPAAITQKDGRVEHDDQGIAQEMARRVIEALCGSGVERIDVLAYGTEEDFCEQLGFRKAGGLVPMTMHPGSSPAVA